MQYRYLSKHQKGQYSGYGVSIANYVNVDPPKYVEPTEYHRLVASRENATTNNGSTSHRAGPDVECQWISEQHSEKKSCWTTPKKIAAAVGGLVIAGGAVISVLIATGNVTGLFPVMNGGNESVDSTQTVVGGVTESGSGPFTNSNGSLVDYSSGSNPTFTTEATSLIPNGLPSSNGFNIEDFDDGISTYTPIIDGDGFTQSIGSDGSTLTQEGTEATTDLSTSVSHYLPTERIVPRYTSRPDERKYNRVNGLSFDECLACVQRFNQFTEEYHGKLAGALWYKSCVYDQRLDYNKAFVEDINTALSILESGREGDPAVHSDRTDITTALQDEKRVLMQEQQALINKLDQNKVDYERMTASCLPNYLVTLRFDGDSDLHPKMKPGNFTSEELQHLNRVAATRERYQLQYDRLELIIAEKNYYEYMASLQAKIDSIKIDIDVIDEDLRLWSGKLPPEATRLEKEVYEAELIKMQREFRSEAMGLINLKKEIRQFGDSVRDKYPEILTYAWQPCTNSSAPSV